MYTYLWELVSNEEYASVVIWSWENALDTVGWLYFPPSLSLYNNFLGQTSVWLGLWRAVHFVSPAGPPQATLRQEAAERSEALKLREKEPLGKQWTSTSNSNHFSSSNFPSQAAKRLLHSSCLKIQQVVLTWAWEDMESLKDSLVSSEKAAAALKVSLLDRASNQGMTSTANLITSSHHISSSIFGLIIREP